MVDISKFLSRAEDALKKRNYQYAIQMYLEALEVEPTHVSARRDLRSVLLKANTDGSKIKAPPSKTVVMSRDPKVQLAEYEKAVVKEPRSAKFNKRVAAALRKIEAHEAAGYVFQYVIDHCDKGKEDVDAMKGGAQAFIDAGLVDHAQKLLSRASRLMPNDREIGDISRELSAKQTMKNIEGKQSDAGPVLMDAEAALEAELLKKKKLGPQEIPKAIGFVDKRLEKNPVDKEMIKKKAELYGMARKYDQSHEWLMSRYEDLESPPDILELAIKYKNQYFEYMLKVCAKKAEENPDKAAAYKAKAQEFEAARKEFRLDTYARQVADAPADLDHRWDYGKALFESGRYQDAVEHLQRAIRSPKLGKEVGVLLGRCFAQMGRLELAQKQLSNVLENVTEAQEDLYMEVRYWLADTEERAGNTDQAKELFQDLFMQNAAFKDVGDRLDKLASKS